jgi:hypothetical protein
MEVGHRQDNPELLPQFHKQAQQSYGIRASGACRRHAISCPEQPLLANILEHFFHHHAE